ncbi:glycosyltransferase family 4 protein [Haloarchaeobius iranensis]|uniref:Glycosyltransferase involved in cell wall bisynthesis n=1 Tax=Haloarchaeobius iranensis TaxID=996166 RepID=A0A1G9WPX9_9EURY|nr:glycosyltransferase family 4 protein [Haloarchaeobius iranensis]SDM86457.1 Glycosyltransferase involved in cell wall bisynthesis [Haloarchaeobius iranensis]
MRVLNHLELESQMHRSGMGTAADQQREALSRAAPEIDVVTSPWTDGSVPDALFASWAYGDDLLVDYDVAHLNMAGPASLALARRAKAQDIPLILHTHVTKEDFRDSFRFSNVVAPALGVYLKQFYSQADLVLCPSEYTKGVLESYPVDAPIKPISNGIDLEPLQGYESFREATRERYDLDGMVVFAVGNVFERKGLTTFCELAQATDYDFTWFGTYEEGPAASKTVRKWTGNPPENVTFTGWVNDKRMAYGAGDVFCFPAKVENQGLVVLEAMACEKACVLRDIPVFREYFEDGHDCLICEDLAEFEAALQRLESNPALRERLGKNARETAESHGLEEIGAELAATYRDLRERH